MGGVIFQRLTLIGIGLIGSSIALAARRAGAVGEIVVQTRSQETLDRARALKLGDRYERDPAAAATSPPPPAVGNPAASSPSANAPGVSMPSTLSTLSTTSAIASGLGSATAWVMLHLAGSGRR